MKNLMIISTMLVALGTANAQENSTTANPAKDPAVMQQRAMDRAEKQTDVMVQELGLDPGQTAKVRSINERFAKQMAELKQAIPDDEARKPRATVLRDTRDRDLKAVLTAEQYEKMLALRKEKKAEYDAKDSDMKVPHNE